jgi:hypothetical protein
MPPIDCVYIAASAQDARYTRICVASIRFFYPHIPIRILPGGRLQAHLVRELRQYWDVELAELAEEGNYGWGFVKLETLFGPPGQRFLVLDSDTVITGPVLDLWSDSRSSFLVDDEHQPESRAKEIYYDWEKLRGFDPNAQPPGFLFNTWYRRCIDTRGFRAVDSLDNAPDHDAVKYIHEWRSRPAELHLQSESQLAGPAS